MASPGNVGATNAGAAPIDVVGSFEVRNAAHLARDEHFEYRIALAQVRPADSNRPDEDEDDDEDEDEPGRKSGADDGYSGFPHAMRLGLRKLEAFAREAKRRGADVVVFPEYFLTGATHDHWQGVREERSPLGTHPEPTSDPSHFLYVVARLARELEMDICAGTAVELGGGAVVEGDEPPSSASQSHVEERGKAREASANRQAPRHVQHRGEPAGPAMQRPIGASPGGDEDDRLFNTAYYIDRKGNLIGKYTKRNLWHPERETLAAATDGTHPWPRTFEIDNGRGTKLTAGMLICWDLGFPEEFRNLLRPPRSPGQPMQGPDVIFMPTCWYATDAGPRGLSWSQTSEANLLDALTLTRAIENECIVALANVSGPSRREAFGDDDGGGRAAAATTTEAGSAPDGATRLEGEGEAALSSSATLGLGHSSVSAPFLGRVGRVPHEGEALLLAAVDVRVLGDARETYRVRHDLAAEAAS